MYNGNRVLGLIPARGGSKGIPHKNIKEIAGHPLISYTIECGLRSKYLDDVVVSTDSEEIAEIAIAFGASVPFMRPAELALDTSKTIECVIHARDTLAEMGEHYDAIVLLQPTSPLRMPADIDGAIELFYSTGKRGVVSISKTRESPILFRTIGDNGELEHLMDASSTVRRQDMPTWYRVDGAVYVNESDSLSLETSLNDNPFGYPIDQDRGIDIDNIDDFYEAERSINNRIVK